ncbi:hypothetical protein KO561_13695 [Radiobacillus kanasensis]|uniref:hypothetical protein n=1 Tax=Radiobacillus kanasensis TaxID=2844358 RepID=UPI001E291367|nr:hypothetical protein [Radiobacillus kanasensis]UFT98249.1 hypothetical protein KO561_13695 [Radiobacillus kanasensis]
MMENKRRDGFIISDNGLDLTYTSDMEKAMHQAHGIGYAEYASDIDKIIEVEQKRELSHQKNHKMVAELNKQVHK